MKRLLKVSMGFTLVELMVVVAIIGILSAIAVPNFKKYQGKSKQSEAKIQLAAVYSTEVAANADYDTYATCITDIGYDVSPKGYYIIGFSSHETTTANQVTGRGGTCGTTGTNGSGNSSTVFPTPATHLKANASASLPGSGSFTNITTSVTSATFTAGASGQIAPAKTTYDTWSITETKTLTNENSVTY